MKKIIYLLITTLFITACSNDDEGDSLIRRTIMIYFSAENNLSSYASEDINEIIVGSRSLAADCNLIVFVDLKSTKPYIMSVTNGETKVLKTYGSDFYASSPDNMLEILQYMVSQCPAREYATIFWGHGTGSIITNDTVANTSASLKAYGADTGSDTSSGSEKWINTTTLARVMSQLPHQQFIMFDACCMQTVETAYELRNTTDYLIAPLCETPSFGGNYATLVPILGHTDIASLPREIIDDYTGSNNEWSSVAKYFSNVCISAVKTSQLDALAAATYTALRSLYAGNKLRLSTNPAAASADDPTSCIYYFKTRGLRAGYPILYDMKDVMRNNLSAEAYQAWLPYLERAVIYKSRPDDIRTTGVCDWFGGDDPNVFGYPLPMFSSANFRSFLLSDDTYGGLAMIVPQDIYSTNTEPDMLQAMFDYQWTSTVGWNSWGW